MFRRTWWLALCFTSSTVFVACSETPGTNLPPGNDAGENMMNPPDGGVVSPALAESAKATLRFKRTERMRNDFAQALQLPPDQVCNELGQYSCTDEVHTIALGGVEPYVLGLREGLADTTVTTPVATDRVALSGCEARVALDFSNPSAAKVFKDLPVAPDGTLSDLQAAGVAQSIDRLYQGVVLRPATDAELAHMKELYTELAATQEPNAARDWAILSCYAVLTTMESLFY